MTHLLSKRNQPDLMLNQTPHSHSIVPDQFPESFSLGHISSLLSYLELQAEVLNTFFFLATHTLNPQSELLQVWEVWTGYVPSPDMHFISFYLEQHPPFIGDIKHHH